jgi:hypothetical protein
MTAAQPPKRVGPGYLAWVSERLSERDWQIIETVNRLHLASGWQLDRLHFSSLLLTRSRAVTRSRTLARLVSWRVLARLPRRIGGAKRGSSVAVYALDTAGQRLLAERASGAARPTSVRRPGAPGDRFVAHVLDVSELAVQLVEVDRAQCLRLREFCAEPAAWWPNGLGSWLKPDAYLVISNGRVDHLWWIEVDRATESLEAVKRKLRTYLDFIHRGQIGPREAIPRVLITTPDERRRRAIATLAARLPAPGDELFHVVLHEQAVAWLAKVLRE